MSYHLAHFLAEQGHLVIFISHKPFFKKKTEIIKDNGGKIIIYSWATTKRPTSFRDIFWYIKIHLKYKPNYIIGHFVGANISIGISKILTFGKVKTLIYYHILSSQIITDINKISIPQKLLFFRKRFFYNFFCDKVICPSEMAKLDLETFYKIFNKGIIILNSIEDRFFGTKSLINLDELIISYLGRFDLSKGVLELINAFLKYCKDFPDTNIKLQLAGSGRLDNKIKELIKNNNKIKKNEKLPYDQVDEYLRNSHFTIIPSKFDNLPTVGLESIMNATPILISYNTGLAQYLEENKECFKFNSDEKSIYNTFKKVGKLTENEFLEMSYHAKKKYLNLFSIEKYNAEIFSLLNKIK